MDAKLQQWQQLHQAIYNCRRCQDELNIVAHRVQPEWNPAKATRSVQKWAMLVGQNPGKREWEKSQALVGRTGSRLQSWFKLAGVDYETYKHQVLKTALVKCYVPSTLTGAVIDRCEGFLRRQIELANPQVIIAMGKFAIQYFFPDVTLEKCVGGVQPWQDTGTTRAVLCVPHFSPKSTWFREHPESAQQIIDSLARLYAAYRETAAV